MKNNLKIIFLGAAIIAFAAAAPVSAGPKQGTVYVEWVQMDTRNLS